MKTPFSKGSFVLYPLSRCRLAPLLVAFSATGLLAQPPSSALRARSIVDDGARSVTHGGRQPLAPRAFSVATPMRLAAATP